MNRSRRAILAACGVGLTTLAGCSRLDISADTRSYDTARLVALSQKEVPRPPATFPVSVSDAMVSQHRERTRALVERIPKQPDTPNATVVERLRQERERVLNQLGEDGGDASSPLEQLRNARDIRGEAAAVEAAYRAATNAITSEVVADRRAQLRSALSTFERDWTYCGDDPVSAVVVH